MALSACMINYNGMAYLGETLAALMAQAHLLCQVLFVDNASVDGSVEFIQRQFPDLEIVRLSTNRGPGAARNAAMSLSASDRIVFLDNDIEIASGCIEQLGRALDENPSAVLAMPSVLYASNRDLIQFEGAGCHFLGLMQLHRQDMPAKFSDGSPKPVNSLVTACFMIDRRRYCGEPRFDETFFFNLEDHDFGIRARLRGHEILRVPTALCYHKQGTPGLSFRRDQPYPQARVGYLVRNRWQVILKNYHWRTLAVLSPILLAFEVIQFAGVFKKGWLRQWIDSVRWLISNRKDLYYRRREVQSLRRTPDRDILSSGRLPITEAVAKSCVEKKALATMGRVANYYWQKTIKFL